MGLTERHWFEDEELKPTEWQLEDTILENKRAYERGYSDRDKEIIRCKDCKYGKPMCQPWEDIICLQNIATHIPDWFCADGKRR